MKKRERRKTKVKGEYKVGGRRENMLPVVLKSTGTKRGKNRRSRERWKLPF